jgi:SAM-dependent methyltransferase
MSLREPNPTVEVHPSQFREQVQRRLLAAVTERRLPARFLYDSPAQAARWLAYHTAWSPSRTEARLLALYDRAFDAALEATSGPALSYVSLGCGGGAKDARLLARAQAQGRRTYPVLTDTSPSLVVEAMLKAPGARGLVVDLEAEPERAAFIDDAAPAVVTAFGMVPNLDHARFLRWLARFLGPEDRALVSANLHPRPWPEAAAAVLPQYDNPEARAWYAGGLAELGLIDPEVAIESRPLAADGGAWRVEVRAESRAPARLRVFDVETDLAAGETFHAFFSNRFTPPAFEAELTSAGLEAEARWLFEGEEEGIWLARARASG